MVCFCLSLTLQRYDTNWWRHEQKREVTTSGHPDDFGSLDVIYTSYYHSYVCRLWNTNVPYKSMMTSLQLIGPRRCGANFKSVISTTLLQIQFMDHESILFPVMAWYQQAVNHYLNQCWTRYMSTGVTRPQRVNDNRYLTSSHILPLGAPFLCHCRYYAHSFPDSTE